MRNTRSSKSAKPAKSATEKSTAHASISGIPLPESNNKNPPKVFILPKDTSSDSRIVTLPHPRSAVPTRYYFCPEKGIYEFTKIAAPKTTPRSWLLTPNRPHPVPSTENGTVDTEKEGSPAETSSNPPTETIQAAAVEESTSVISKGYTTVSANLFLTTPLDPLFLLLPALIPEKSSKKLFLCPDDYFDNLTASSPHFRPILQSPRMRDLFEARMSTICDTVDAGGEDMHRLSEEKLIAELVRKAQGVVEKGLPASLEERFVKKALEAPVMCIRREESSITIVSGETEDEIPAAGTQTPSTDSTVDSQSTSASTTTATTVSESTPSTPSATSGVARLLRLRTVLTYLTTNYLPPTLLPTLPQPAVDFTPLDSHLTHLASLRAAAIAARSLGDSFSRKRGIDETDEAEERAEKKRKKEEEEKRKKAGESRAVRDLKKVDVSGMRKLSDFFGKKGKT